MWSKRKILLEPVAPTKRKYRCGPAASYLSPGPRMTSKRKTQHRNEIIERAAEPVGDQLGDFSPLPEDKRETIHPLLEFRENGMGEAVTKFEAAPPKQPTRFERERPQLNPDLYINRELSWLEFNRRVLEVGENPATPLLERVKFAAIFASNLDEFFMIRVAGIKRKVVAGIGDPGPDGRTPSAAYAAVRAVTQNLLERHATLLKHELLPQLSAEGVAVVNVAELDPKEQVAMAGMFERDIFPILTPQAIDRARRFPHVSNQSLNLIVALRSTTAGSRFARIKVPAVLPRLIVVPGSEHRDERGKTNLRMVFLEQVIAYHLPRLFPGNEIVASYPFHVIRDSDIDVDEDEDEAHDLLNTMREFLSQRTFGSVIQVITDTSMPEEVRLWLLDQLHAGSPESYVIDGPLACESLLSMPKIDRPDLTYPQFTPATVPALEVTDELTGEMVPMPPRDIFELLRERDVVIHHPYQTFNAVADFLRAAATDPDVVAIKQTLYRIGKDSPLIPALIEARDDDTQVAVLVELKARFDEENNITWAQQLEQHGVHVAYGVAGLKTHCKATLVVRRERDGLRRYVHIATGNYNATTARIYEDVGLLTAREDIGSDVSELFNVLTGYSQQENYRKLWVAPVHLRTRFLEAIDREIEAHERTGDGRLIFKMNSLVDREIIRALYAASQAGVKIDLIIRGICCLRPGVPGWSETIRVRSLVGRFLEHSRIYYFRNGGDEEVYLGSADLMERNLDRRVEAIVPVEDASLRRHLREKVLGAYLRDTVNARELQSDGSYVQIKSKRQKEQVDVHRRFIDLYARRPI
jgi:polyphosphate kinase